MPPHQVAFFLSKKPKRKSFGVKEVVLFQIFFINKKLVTIVTTVTTQYQ